MIRTKRCYIININENDILDLKKLYEDERVWSYLGGLRNELQIQNNIERAISPQSPAQYFIVRSIEGNSFLGTISLDVHHNNLDIEISYTFSSSRWGNGFALETVEAIVEYAFQSFNLERLLAETQVLNKPSCKMLTKLGFAELERTIRFEAEQIIFVIYRSNTV